MTNLADAPFLNHLLGQGDCGNATVIVHQEVSHAGFFDGLDHLFGFAQGVGQRLLTDDVLTLLGGFEHHRTVQIAGCRDIN